MSVAEAYGEDMIKVPPKKLAPMLRDFESMGRTLKKLYRKYRDEVEPYFNVKFILAKCKEIRPDVYSLLKTRKGIKWLNEVILLSKKWFES